MASLKDTFNLFFWGTFGFFILKYSVRGTQMYWSILFIMISIVLMYFVNVSVYKSQCGFTDGWAVFKATFLPWVLIFGVMVTLIQMFPGWKAPFSNTVGYVCAQLSPSITELKGYISEDKLFVKNDPLLFVNEINMQNLEEVLTSDYMNLFTTESLEAAKEIIRNLVFMKELISEWMWFMLTGFITISTSYNLLANTPCMGSVEDHTDKYNKHLVEEEALPTKSSRQYFD